VTTGQHIVEISLEIQKTLLAPMLLVFGGETTVTLCDAPGFGGRCQEMALSAAIHLSGQLGITLLAAGTDGSDGPDGPDGAAAGAIVDGRTVGENDVEARQALRENNAYEFLNKRVALVKTGPTGTNVNDIVLVLVEPR
jgi:glycerate 2-kinase